MNYSSIFSPASCGAFFIPACPPQQPTRPNPAAMSEMSEIRCLATSPGRSAARRPHARPRSCASRPWCVARNTRRMAETAARLVDHVFPPLPVRQWVLAVSKRLHYFLQRGRRGQCPFCFGKPTLAIKASRHCVGIILIGTPEF